MAPEPGIGPFLIWADNSRREKDVNAVHVLKDVPIAPASDQHRRGAVIGSAHCCTNQGHADIQLKGYHSRAVIFYTSRNRY
jgi:hypothetical protein